MELDVSFVCDSKSKVITKPHSPTRAKINFRNYEKAYDISLSAVGYSHKAKYDIPTNLKLNYNESVTGTPATYESAVKKILTTQLRSKRVRDIKISVKC